MNKYEAIYCRIEHHILRVACEAENAKEANKRFNELYLSYSEVDTTQMECIHCEDFMQDISEVK